MNRAGHRRKEPTPLCNTIMSDEPVAGQWDYERDRSQTPSVGEKFSIGLFQWLSKRRSKGLKKSKSIRIIGYVGDPDAVYQKADELSRRFNEEGVSVENPPPWLQKQYAVRRPAHLVIERTLDELTGAEVRPIRLEVMTNALGPHGFVKHGGMNFVRQQGDQYHVIEYQTGKYGHEYTLGIGFHYTWVPGFPQWTTIPPIGWTMMPSPADVCCFYCALHAHVGEFGPNFTRGQTWFKYGTDRDSFTRTLMENVTEGRRQLDVHARRWNDPAYWLSEEVEASRRDVRILFPWRVSALFIACVAIHLDQPERANREIGLYLERARQIGQFDYRLEEVQKCCAAMKFEPSL